jgi:hypothetical protein
MEQYEVVLPKYLSLPFSLLYVRRRRLAAFHQMILISKPFLSFGPQNYWKRWREGLHHTEEPLEKDPGVGGHLLVVCLSHKYILLVGLEVDRELLDHVFNGDDTAVCSANT